MGDLKFLTLDDGAETGIKEEILFDWDAGKATTKTTYTPTFDTNAVLENNKILQNHTDGFSPTRELQHVASIPLSVVMLWIDKYGVDPTARGNEALLARLLNDPEWRELRTGLGRVNFKNR